MISLLLVLLVIEIAGGVLTYTKKQDVIIYIHVFILLLTKFSKNT